MRRFGLLLLLATSVSIVLKAQLKNSFSVADNPEFDKVKFSLNAMSGQCFIEPGDEETIMDIHSNTEDSTNPQYEEKVIDRTKEVSVALMEEHNSTLGSTISRHMFGSQSLDDYTWKVYLSKLKPLDLDLNYAIGDTYIDLSDLPVEKLKMRSGSAHVKVNYKKDHGNLSEMDTFLIRVDLGSFEAKNLHLCQSSNIITDIGFGNVKMDFGDAQHISTNVSATVGAGKLEVILPHENIPIRIDVNESPLCNIKIPRGYEMIEESVFASPDFLANSSDGINFSIDVAVGNIIFR